MKRAKLSAQIDKILWEVWDPIGINDCGPDDEYNQYVPSVLKLLVADADQSKIAKLLHHHANENMGLETTLDFHLSTAKLLKSLV